MPKAPDENRGTVKGAQDDDLVMNLVEMALSQAPEAREAYLEKACEGDQELFGEVWEYVRWNHRMQDFLLEPLYPAAKEYQFAPDEVLAGRFRILRQVAQGGMGIVYEAEDERLGRRIALKCAKNGFRKRLSPEVRHASDISHPNVCKTFEIHTASTDAGEIDFLTMEFLEGETLAARLSEGPILQKEARAIGRQICAGLAEAHRHRVVHGDLKSNNVILEPDSGSGPASVRAVITDFGLARRPLDAASAGESGGWASAGPSSQAGGTPDYMAPELWKGEKPSAASDVYALGVMLYELAAGRRPYGREIPWADRLEQKPPAIRHTWNAALQKCLDPDPARRFRNAGEVAEALEPSRALPWWLAAAAAAVLATVSGVVTYERATAPKETVTLAMLPLESAANESGLAERVSRDTASQLAHLTGGSRARLAVISWNDVIGRRADTAEKAHSLFGATHVLHGTLAMENGKVVIRAILTDARSQGKSGEWKAEYAPGEVRYAALGMAGLVTGSLKLPALSIPAVNAAANQNYLAGLAYTRRNSTVDKALPLLESAVAADGDSPLTWAGLAEAQWVKYFVTKDPAWLDRSSESLRQAQGRDLDLAPVHRVTGLLRANAGFYEQAEAEYLRAIELEPANGDAYRRLGQIYERASQMDRALAALKKAVELQPSDFKAYQDLGVYYSRLGDEVEATRQLEKCVQLAPDEADPHRVLAMAYKDLGRYPDAERESRVAVGLAESAPALVSLAVALMYQQKDAEAIPFLVRAVNQAPDEDQWWTDLGIAYERANLQGESAGAFQHALQQAERAMARDPRDGVVRSRMAFLFARLGDGKRAESEIAQAVQLSPASGVTKGAAVWTYEALGRRQDSLAILGNASDDVLLDAARWPSLADLHKDARFQHLLLSRQLKP
jgi:eukaryotic-like serine/threonine-protein kinase